MPSLGDCTLDGKVDEKDATILAANLQLRTIYGDAVDGVGWTGGDFNNDGRVDRDDVEIIATNWLKTADTAVAVSIPRARIDVVADGCSTCGCCMVAATAKALFFPLIQLTRVSGILYGNNGTAKF